LEPAAFHVSSPDVPGLMASLEKPTGNYVQPESTLKAADTEAENNSQVAELERNVTALKESLYLTGWRLHLMTFGSV
jgi:hypothetical protein